MQGLKAQGCFRASEPLGPRVAGWPFRGVGFQEDGFVEVSGLGHLEM